jgi:hypothetical protein
VKEQEFMTADEYTLAAHGGDIVDGTVRKFSEKALIAGLERICSAG